MNTNPSATTILCYGDSNTWGHNPNKKGRYPANIRWTGKLQQTLGDDYYVVEEGLGSRTTDLEYSKPGRNGKTYLLPCIVSHYPLDIVVMMLGTNDLKTEFQRDPPTIASAIRGLIQDIKANAWDENHNTSKIILVSPIVVDDTSVRFEEIFSHLYDHDSAIKSHELAKVLAAVAAEEGCTFLDASTVAEPGVDGIHFTEESHAALATLIAETIATL